MERDNGSGEQSLIPVRCSSGHSMFGKPPFTQK